MVDPIGFKPPSIADRRLTSVSAVERVAQTQPVQAVTPKVTDQKAVETSSLQAAAQAMASSPPVNAERVAEIRRAVQNGTFPLVPSTIADRLIALRQGWSNNDAS